MNGTRRQKIVNPSKTRRPERAGSGDTALRAQLARISHSIRECGPSPVRSCHAVQRTEQRHVAGFVQVPVRETRLDICRSAQQVEKGIAGPHADLSDRPGPEAEQGELVRDYLAGARRHRRLGNPGAGMAKGCLPALDATGSNTETPPSQKKTPSPYYGLRDALIGPYGGLRDGLSSPYNGPMRAIFAPLPSPWYGHHLDIPLGTGDVLEGDFTLSEAGGSKSAENASNRTRHKHD